MRRFCICVCFTLGLLALSAPQPLKAASAVADTLVEPTQRDTIQAGEWTITGEVEKPEAKTSPTAEDAIGIDQEERRELKAELLQIGSREVAGLRQWQRRKNPTVAWLSSVAMPGLGQLYNGRRIKVLLAAGGRQCVANMTRTDQPVTVRGDVPPSAV